MTFAFDSMTAFFAMGKHGVYVWSAWALVVCALGLLIVFSRHARKQVKKRILLQMQRDINSRQ